jgi:AraC-like DNA-binding protein
LAYPLLLFRIQKQVDSLSRLRICGLIDFSNDILGNKNFLQIPEMVMRELKVANELAFQYYHRLQEIKRFIEEHYSEEISLKKAARIAGLEKKYFSTFFHRKVGVGFKHWLTHLRVARAMDLMKAEDYAISEVAYSAGFKDIRSFERAFKKYTKRTPRDFKNGVRARITNNVVNKLIFVATFRISVEHWASF